MQVKRWVALAGMLVLAGCEEAPPAPAAQPAQAGAAAAPSGRAAAALREAEERLRARLRIDGAATLRAVQVHRQALPDTLAVCGQVNPTGRAEDPFLPFVAVTAFEGERLARADFFLAATSPEAARVYFEMVDRCWDGGGPTTTRPASRPLPPAPSGLPQAREVPPAQPPAAAALAPPAGAPAATPPVVQPAPMEAAGPPQGSVTTSQRTPVNIRASASGGGEVLRVVPRGSTLQVFGTAPGGWFQVGEGEPWGWVHGSMLDGR